MTQYEAAMVISNRNHEKYVAAAVESALRQEGHKIQVITVDDGSTDESWDEIGRFAKQGVVALQSGGVGQAGAWAMGLTAVTAPVVLLLDSDDVSHPTRSACVLQEYRDADVAWVFNGVRHVRDSAWALDDFLNRPVERGRRVPIDYRGQIAANRWPGFRGPATSGLSFRRNFISRLLPVRASEGVTISDNYLKFAAVATSKGCMLLSDLSLLRLHGSNLYTGTSAEKARSIKLATASELLHLDERLYGSLARSLLRDAVPGGREGLTPLAQIRYDEFLAELPMHRKMSWRVRRLLKKIIRRRGLSEGSYGI